MSALCIWSCRLGGREAGRLPRAFLGTAGGRSWAGDQEPARPLCRRRIASPTNKSPPRRPGVWGLTYVWLEGLTTTWSRLGRQQVARGGETILLKAWKPGWHHARLSVSSYRLCLSSWPRGGCNSTWGTAWRHCLVAVGCSTHEKGALLRILPQFDDQTDILALRSSLNMILLVIIL